ncbi:hypothetical protein J7E99_32540 [Streptomyces sp. ISL-44]|uniref:hypothetical protein n=1 Tax=Streptomyces sp. ISL-44 TaxID=2819184 RepID=UPI001BEA2103|nr:hypothetical protein [Streptomyces sp. ISL-44]MBT2545301.1 hypothetical protein [Streptomyces sp. ISL-44]
MLDGRRRTFKVAAMPAEIRRLAVVEGDRGLEAMALFIGRGGRMLSKQRWEQIFDEAHLRSLRLSEEYESDIVMPARLRIHDTRHTFAIYMLHLLTHLVLREEAERYLAGDPSAFLTDHLSRNPLLILQRILGHQSPKTTLRYLTYIRNTNALVTKAIAEWSNRESTYADYAADLAAKEVA